MDGFIVLMHSIVTSVFIELSDNTSLKAGLPSHINIPITS